MVTLDDVAARAGVSRMTASNAIRGKSVVKASTARRVLKAASELGYKPNIAARQLSSGRTHIIGMSVADLDFIFPAVLAAELSDEAFRRGYQLITQQTRLSTDYERAMMGSASAQICDGTIVCWPSAGVEAMADFAKTHPMVVLDGYDLEGRVDTVFTPCVDGSRAAVAHLIDHGARRILMLGTSYRTPEELAEVRGNNGLLRLRGAWEAIRDARARGVDIAYGPENVHPSGWSREAGYEAMTRVLRERPERDFDAVFALTDAIAIGALKALTDAGVSVPGDVMVIGFDGTEDGKYTNPGLSSVVIDVKEIAKKTLDMLVERIEAVHGDESDESPAPRTGMLGYRIAARGSAER